MVKLERGGEGKGRERRQRKLRGMRNGKRRSCDCRRGGYFFFPDNDIQNRVRRSSDSSACDSGPSLQLILEKR